MMWFFKLLCSNPAADKILTDMALSIADYPVCFVAIWSSYAQLWRSNFLNFIIGLNFMNFIINNIKFIKFNCYRKILSILIMVTMLNSMQYNALQQGPCLLQISLIKVTHKFTKSANARVP